MPKTAPHSWKASLPQRNPPQHPLLLGDQCLHPLPRIRHHLRKLRLIECLSFRRRLHFHHLVSSRHYEIHVHIGARVLFITQVEQDFSAHNPHPHPRHKISQRKRSQSSSFHQLLQRQP